MDHWRSFNCIFELEMELGTVHLGSDSESADLLLAIQVFSTGVGLIALISLVRTILAWRKSP